MRLPAVLARRPWLRTGLVLLALVGMPGGGVRLWTSLPPTAVHITITHLDRDDTTNRLISNTVTADRTIQNSAVAERLQRDLAALKLFGIFDSVSCPAGPRGSEQHYNTYTLTWYWAGLPVEYAHQDRTGCAFWHDDLVLTHWSNDDEGFVADIEAAVTASG